MQTFPKPLLALTPSSIFVVSFLCSLTADSAKGSHGVKRQVAKDTKSGPGRAAPRFFRKCLGRPHSDAYLVIALVLGYHTRTWSSHSYLVITLVLGPSSLITLVLGHHTRTCSSHSYLVRHQSSHTRSQLSHSYFRMSQLKSPLSSHCFFECLS